MIRSWIDKVIHHFLTFENWQYCFIKTGAFLFIKLPPSRLKSFYICSPPCARPPPAQKVYPEILLISRPQSLHRHMLLTVIRLRRDHTRIFFMKSTDWLAWQLTNRRIFHQKFTRCVNMMMPLLNM